MSRNLSHAVEGLALNLNTSFTPVAVSATLSYSIFGSITGYDWTTTVTKKRIPKEQCRLSSGVRIFKRCYPLQIYCFSHHKHSCKCLIAGYNSKLFSFNFCCHWYNFINNFMLVNPSFPSAYGVTILPSRVFYPQP